jgi:hypothetical protein
MPALTQAMKAMEKKAHCWRLIILNRRIGLGALFMGGLSELIRVAR